MAEISSYNNVETKNNAGVTIASPTSVLRFLGAGVAVSQVGAETQVNIPGGAGALEVRKDSGVVVSAFTALNFTGSNITVTQSPTGVANISVSPSSQITVQKDGGLVSAAIGTINFTGPNITVTQSPTGTAIVSVSSGSTFSVRKDSVLLSSNISELNFNGANITVSVSPSNRANITVSQNIAGTPYVIPVVNLPGTGLETGTASGMFNIRGNYYINDGFSIPGDTLTELTKVNVKKNIILDNVTSTLPIFQQNILFTGFANINANQIVKSIVSVPSNLLLAGSNISNTIMMTSNGGVSTQSPNSSVCFVNPSLVSITSSTTGAVKIASFGAGNTFATSDANTGTHSASLFGNDIQMDKTISAVAIGNNLARVSATEKAVKILVGTFNESLIGDDFAMELSVGISGSPVSAVGIIGADNATHSGLVQNRYSTSYLPRSIASGQPLSAANFQRGSLFHFIRNSPEVLDVSIIPGYPGREITLVNRGSNAVTINNNANVKVPGTSVSLGQNDVIRFIFVENVWYCFSYTNNN